MPRRVAAEHDGDGQIPLPATARAFADGGCPQQPLPNLPRARQSAVASLVAGPAIDEVLHGHTVTAIAVFHLVWRSGKQSDADEAVVCKTLPLRADVFDSCSISVLAH